MEKIFRNSVKRTIAIIFLGVFAFSFLHSEIGFVNLDGGNHGDHDYCQIVKYSTTHTSKIITDNLVKVTVERAICFHCFEEITAQENVNLFILNNECFSSKQSSEIYLHNSTFLI